MELQYYGANCIRVQTKKASILIDDTLEDVGLKSVAREGDILLYTNEQLAKPYPSKLTIASPGEYEVSDVSIQGIPARAHVDEKGTRSVIYKIVAEDVRIVVIGHIYPSLTDEQLEAIGTVDVAVIPVGGHGYTLDGIGATKVLKQIEPKIIIPTHYDDSRLKYEVPAASLEEAVRGLAMEVTETVAKLKVKSEQFTDTTKLIVLERQ